MRASMRRRNWASREWWTDTRRCLRRRRAAPMGSSARQRMPDRNNFDLIRLAAALQVAGTHTLPYFVPESRSWYPLRFIELFPGVPVFFFVSGFLISKSFENNSNLAEYARNRALRIYPGLIVCFLASLAAVALTGYFSAVHPTPMALLAWVA